MISSENNGCPKASEKSVIKYRILNLWLVGNGTQGGTSLLRQWITESTK